MNSFICMQVTATETNVSSGDSGQRSYIATVVDGEVRGNEAPVFTPDSYTFSVVENVIDTQVIGTLTVSDDDGM